MDQRVSSLAICLPVTRFTVNKLLNMISIGLIEIGLDRTRLNFVEKKKWPLVFNYMKGKLCN